MAFLVGALALILIVNGFDTRDFDQFGVGVTLAMFYPFTLPFLQAAVTANVYPWFLTTKAQKQSAWQSYWYWKFRYRLPRYLLRTLKGAKGELFVHLHVLGLSETAGKPALPNPVPNLSDLLRAFRERTEAAGFRSRSHLSVGSSRVANRIARDVPGGRTR